VVVSPQFEGQSIVQRHRSVNHLLDAELKTQGGIHALSLVLKTPEQWAKSSEVSASPNCRGGSKN
jgi:BolA protein